MPERLGSPLPPPWATWATDWLSSLPLCWTVSMTLTLGSFLRDQGSGRFPHNSPGPSWFPPCCRMHSVPKSLTHESLSQALLLETDIRTRFGRQWGGLQHCLSLGEDPLKGLPTPLFLVPLQYVSRKQPTDTLKRICLCPPHSWNVQCLLVLRAKTTRTTLVGFFSLHRLTPIFLPNSGHTDVSFPQRGHYPFKFKVFLHVVPSDGKFTYLFIFLHYLFSFPIVLQISAQGDSLTQMTST